MKIRSKLPFFPVALQADRTIASSFEVPLILLEAWQESFG
jgi:hypothetical protein